MTYRFSGNPGRSMILPGEGEGDVWDLSQQK